MIRIIDVNINKLRLQDKKLYLITSSANFKSEETFLDAIASALQGGVRMIQLKANGQSTSTIIRLGKRIRELCSIYDSLFIVHDRVDIAKVIDADGVHLDQECIDIHTARDILGTTSIIGMSVNSIDQAVIAQESGADYITVKATAEDVTPVNKKEYCDFLKWASENISIPFYAHEDIDIEDIQNVLRKDDIRIAVESSVIHSKNPEMSAKSIIEKLK